MNSVAKHFAVTAKQTSLYLLIPSHQSTFLYAFTLVYIQLALHYNQDHHCSDGLSEFTSVKLDFSFRIYVIIKPTFSQIIAPQNLQTFC